ncbi:MAG TPA: undecaprenyl-diphosphate phosphatase, partial [Candidatus Paceibacterota bacterium]|nr:undecaprenyl-diphosphate phosphatase [Candidatus Paceibacterota bacterium]
AARFSFLLGLPVIVGSGLKMLLELISSGEDVAWFSVFVGSIVAFVVGLISIRFLLSFIRKHSLWPFIWYRIALACFVLFVTFFG